MTSSSIIGSKEQILERDGHIKGLLTDEFPIQHLVKDNILGHLDPI
jgi:hypothetical protein